MTLTLKLGQTFQTNYLPMVIYLFKVNTRNTTTRCEVCSKLIKKLIILTLNIFTPCSSASIVNIEQVNSHRIGILKPLHNVPG